MGRLSPFGRLIAAAVQHIPPKGQQTVRYYGLYSNKSRGMADTTRPMLIPAPAPVPLEQQVPAEEILLVPAPPKQTARALRPLWRDLIIRVWGGDPLRCPCCKATMKVVGTLQRPEEIEFFLLLHGLWEGVINLPRPPPPPFDVEKRRGIGGVLDGGAAGARRVSPPSGAGESNHGAGPASVARPQGVDPGRQPRRRPRLVRPIQPLAAKGNPPRRPHPGPRRRLTDRVSPAL